ncbi:MAG: hypothetical protein D6814_04235 [Calditrichaeota bacterium]|nr:MAG: hypothetical protein D6814_04235 [Calditrichota bacterium]
MNSTLAKLSAAMAITRPINALITGLSVAIAVILARPIVDFRPVIFALVSAMILASAGNVINDWYDYEIDRVNRPQRVLPAGRLSRRFAARFAIILFVCGFFFSIFINKFAVLIAGASVLLLITYSAKLKRTVLWGNLAVSFMTGLAFVYGALAAGRWEAGVIPGIFAFLFHFGREILKDLEDVPGDAALAAVTLPIRYGPRVTRVAITLVYGLLIVSTFVPYALRIYGGLYLAVVLPGVDVVLATLVALLWIRGEKANLRLYSQILKADMLVGLFAIYLGK